MASKVCRSRADEATYGVDRLWSDLTSGDVGGEASGRAPAPRRRPAAGGESKGRGPLTEDGSPRAPTGRGWAFERRLVGLVLAAFVLRACFVPWPGDEASADESAEPGTSLCETGRTLDRVPSPNGVWEAVVYRRTCRIGPLSGQTVTDNGLRLVSARDRSRAQVIFEESGSGEEYDRPFLAWTAPDIVRVTIQSPPLDVKTRDFDGVHVDPDDPEIVAAKADWERRYNEALVRLRKEMALRKERDR